MDNAGTRAAVGRSHQSGTAPTHHGAAVDESEDAPQPATTASKQLRRVRSFPLGIDVY
jgi:hypothetical protein